MYTSVYTYPWDVRDETPQVFLANVRERLGVDTISLAATYHAAKLILPHNPRRKVYYPEDGVLYFRPDLAAFAASEIQPPVGALAQEEDMLATVCAAAATEGLGVIAWTVCLHNTRLGLAYPQYTPRNAWDDPAITYLCPSHAAVRAYVVALTTDLARRYPLKALQLEAAHHMPFVHGFHHEMQQVRVTPALAVLLGLCFCPACLELARVEGVDGTEVRAYVVAEVQKRLAAGGGEVEQSAWAKDYWADALDGQLQRYMALRSKSVARLLGEVYQSVHAAADVAIYAQEQSFMFGSTASSAVDASWQSGLDVPPRSGTADGVAVLGYFSGVERFARELDAYRTRIPATMPLEVALRPCPPDCASAEELAAKVAHCAAIGAAGISFYNYGQMPLANMVWVAQALAAL